MIAAALLLLSLGLPWSMVTTWKSTFHAGGFLPGPCTITPLTADHEVMRCVPIVQTDGWLDSQPQIEAIAGARHGGRFGVVAGLVLVTLAWRLRRPRLLLLAAAVVATVTALTAGFGLATAGSGAAWIAAALLAAGGMFTAPSAGQGSASK